MKTEEVEAKHK